MEGNKLEISGRVTSDPPPASYKQIPDADAQGAFKERPKSLTKSLKSNNEMDGADEQMLPKEEKKAAVDSKVDVGDVKFTSNEKQNGEAKLDIGDVKAAFVGMSKEELMKFANDPFWVRLRWILFVSFWLLWLAMLAGAILIIIAAPKCSPPTPRTWYEEGPLTEVSPDIKIEKLQSLKDNKMRAIIISKIDDSYNPVNDSTELINFIQLANELELNVIVELSPAASNLWFDKSEGKVDNYTNYYIWAKHKTTNLSGTPEPPNNWMSPNGGSAWKYSEPRKEFFYAPNGTPHLNFRNQDVVNEFSEVIKQWLDVGAKGIRLKGAPTLLVNKNLTDEAISPVPGFVHDEYDFYKHKGSTVNVEGLGDILKQWRSVVREHKHNNGPLMVAEDIHTLEPYLVNKTALSFDLPRHSRLFYMPQKLNNASLIHKELNSTFEILGGKIFGDKLLGENWPLWQYDENSPALSTDVLDILVMLLPGSVQVSPSAQINPELLKIRGTASVMFGDTHRELLANNTVFAYLRVASGNPGYLVACNPTDKLTRVDFTTMKKVSDEVTIQVLSANFNVTLYDIPEMTPSLKIKANDIHIPPKSAIVLTYVPKST